MYLQYISNVPFSLLLCNSRIENYLTFHMFLKHTIRWDIYFHEQSTCVRIKSTTIRSVGSSVTKLKALILKEASWVDQGTTWFATAFFTKQMVNLHICMSNALKYIPDHTTVNYNLHNFTNTCEIKNFT